MNASKTCPGNTPTDATRITAKPAYVDNPTFHEPDVERRLMLDAPPLPEADTGWYRVNDAGRTRGRASCNLLPDAERLAFLQMNYCRFRAAQLSGDDPADAPQRSAWLARAASIRNAIVSYFLDIPVKIVALWRRGPDQSCELIAAGNVHLIRAADRFNVQTHTLGFGGWVYWFVWARMYKHREHEIGHTTRRVPWSDAMTPKTRPLEEKRESDRGWLVESLRKILLRNLAGLDALELQLVRLRYSTRVPPNSNNPMGILPVYAIEQRLHIHHRRIVRVLTASLIKLRAALDRFIDGPARVAGLGA